MEEQTEQILIIFVGIINLKNKTLYLPEEYLYKLFLQDQKNYEIFIPVKPIQYKEFNDSDKQLYKNKIVQEIIQEDNRQFLSYKNKFQLINELIQIFKVSFQKLLVYVFLRNKNFVIKNGYVFSVDYLVSQNNGNIHSQYLVKFLNVNKELEQNQIIRLSRIAANSKKKLLLLYFTNEQINELKELIQKQKISQEYMKKITLQNFIISKQKN